MDFPTRINFETTRMFWFSESANIESFHWVCDRCFRVNSNEDFYQRRAKPTRIESLVAHVTCGSDEDYDYEDPIFLVAVDDISDESESEPMLLEVNECLSEAEERERQSVKSSTARPYWSKVSARNTVPSIPPFIMTTEENPENMLPMEYFKHFISDELLNKICEPSNIFLVQKDVNKPLDLH
nr:hypothetical protein HmN_000660500 [Hymenolepis microstoma]